MVHVGSSFFSIVGRPLAPGAAPDETPTVVWLRGEHDIATDGPLRVVLGGAIEANDSDIVVDLSEVELVTASTLGVIVTAQKFLMQRSRSLTVRSPSPFVRRIIGICGLDDLLAPSGQEGDMELHPGQRR